MHRLAHLDGEVASALAAGAQGSIFVLSSFSTASIEEVAEQAPDTIKWFQMYIYKNRSINMDFMKRAEKAGYKAIVITVDAPVHGKTYLKYPDFDLPPNLSLSNFVGITDRPSQTVSSSFTIEDLKWILSSTSLPVIAKGVLTKEGAKIVRDAGCTGVIVSNHGGRQLDGTPSSIESLPEVVRAVGKDITVMFDSGIRGGDDVFKAIALGAKYVFIGRPVFYGLAVEGQKGVEGVLDTLKQELENVMALSGCASLSDVKRDRVVHWKYYQGLLRNGDEL
ncbi:HAO1.2 family protein [Megaselia abdita]